MLQQQTPKHKRKGPIRFPGIMEFTRQQGLERTHVWRVLTGERRSPRLMVQWELFTAKHLRRTVNQVYGSQTSAK